MLIFLLGFLYYLHFNFFVCFYMFVIHVCKEYRKERESSTFVLCMNEHHARFCSSAAGRAPTTVWWFVCLAFCSPHNIAAGHRGRTSTSIVRWLSNFAVGAAGARTSNTSMAHFYFHCSISLRLLIGSFFPPNWSGRYSWRNPA